MSYQKHAACHRMWLCLYVRRNVTHIDQTITIFGQKCSMPAYVVCTPTFSFSSPLQPSLGAVSAPHTLTTCYVYTQTTILSKLGHPGSKLNLIRATAKHGVIRMAFPFPPRHDTALFSMPYRPRHLHYARPTILST
jgi:hypothetical protein